MMDKAAIIDHFCNDPEYKKICRQVAYSHADDMFQDLIVYLMEMPEEKLIQIYASNPKAYFYGMAATQYRSTNSKFFRTYKKFEGFLLSAETIEFPDLVEEDPVVDEELFSKVYDGVQEAIKNLPWEYRAVLTLYLENESTRKTAAMLGMHYQTVWAIISKVRMIIASQLRPQYKIK